MDDTALRTANDNSRISVISINNKKFLKGTQPGDEVALYNIIGQLVSSFRASQDMVEISQRGMVLIKIKSGNHYYILKTVL